MLRRIQQEKTVIENIKKTSQTKLGTASEEIADEGSIRKYRRKKLRKREKYNQNGGQH